MDGVSETSFLCTKCRMELDRIKLADASALSTEVDIEMKIFTLLLSPGKELYKHISAFVLILCMCTMFVLCIYILCIY